MTRWQHTLHLADVFHNADMSFEQRRDVIVARIQRAHWYDDNDFSLLDPVELLADAETPEDFDDAWDEFYDWANRELVWVKTR